MNNLNKKTQQKTNHLDKIKKKKHFFSFLSLYFLGFAFLVSIKETINQDGYLLSALLAPAFIAIAIIGVSYSLYKNKD